MVTETNVEKNYFVSSNKKNMGVMMHPSEEKKKKNFDAIEAPQDRTDVSFPRVK